MVWDCRALRALLRGSKEIDLAEIVREVVSIRPLPKSETPDAFFEVELRGVVRLKNDQLVSATAVSDYLSQVAPVPFHPEFSFGDRIRNIIEGHVDLCPVEISVNGSGPILKPHRDTFEVSAAALDAFTEIERVEAKAVDGKIAAIGWILHHAYIGALPVGSKFRGLRFRCGDIQVGEGNLLEDLFSETRFNSWSVGEIHVLDNRIVPNGRRDHFEQNSHYLNMLVQLAPAAREISRRCRQSSVERKWLRDFETHERLLGEKASIIQQRGLPEDTRRQLLAEAKGSLARLEKVAGLDGFVFLNHGELQNRYDAAVRRLGQSSVAKMDLDGLGHLPKARQRFLRELVRLVYKCSVNRVAARSLIERIFAEEGLAPPPEQERSA
jgi:molecular chaperone HtpG